MELKQLVYFYEVCQELNFSKTAQRIFMTQQGISKAIKSLEEEFEVDLFYREFGGLSLTQAGNCLLEECKIILKDVDVLRNKMEQYARDKRPVLKIGVTVGVYTVLPKHFFDDFMKEYPWIQVESVESRDFECEKSLAMEELDLAIVVSPVNPIVFKEDILVKDMVCAIVNRSHPLAKKEFLTYEDFAKEPIILQDEGHRSYYNFLEICRKKGFEPNIVYKVIDIMSIYDLCSDNKGIGFTLNRLRDRIIYEDLKILPIIGEENMWSISLIQKRGKQQTEAMKHFIKFAKNRGEG